MALGDITKKILADARERAAQIERAARTERKRILQAVEDDNKAYERRSNEETERTIAQRERIALSQARRDARRDVDRHKRTLVDAVFADAAAQLAAADDATYATFLRGALQDVDASARAVITQVRAPRERMTVTEAVCRENGINAPLVADETIAAGAVLVSDTADYNITLARLLADRRAALEATVAQTLFGTR